MHKTLMLALVLLFSAAWLQAQDQSPKSDSSQTENTTTSNSDSNSGKTTVEGCLQGSSGNYTLMVNSGTTYQLSGDTSKLSEHVGHEVAITGTTSGSGASGSSMSQSGSSAGSSGSNTLMVEKVKHMSKTCTAGK